MIFCVNGLTDVADITFTLFVVNVVVGNVDGDAGLAVNGVIVDDSGSVAGDAKADECSSAVGREVVLWTGEVVEIDVGEDRLVTDVELDVVVVSVVG